MAEYDALGHVQNSDMRWTEPNMLSSIPGISNKTASHESGIFSNSNNEHVIQYNNSPVNGQADAKSYNSFGSVGPVSSADSGVVKEYSSHSSSSHGDRSHSKEHRHSSSHHSSNSNGEKSHSKDPKHHSSSTSSKDGDKHRSSSSSHRDHSKSSDHRHSSSSSHSKSHSSSSGDKAHSASGTHSSSGKSGSSGGENSKPKDESSKSKHSSSSSHHSSSHKSSSSDSKDKHHSKSSHDSSSKHRDSHSSSKSHHEASSRDASKMKDPSFKSPSATPSVSMTPSPSPNVVVKMDAAGHKIKSEMSDSSFLASPVMKDKPKPHMAVLTPSKIKTETIAAPSDDDDEVPLSMRIKAEVKPEPSHISSTNKQKRKQRESEDEDSDTPLSVRKNKKMKQEADMKKHKADDDDFKPKKAKPSKSDGETPGGKGGKKAKTEEEETSWKWWEEEPKEEGVKWKSLEHKGPVFAPAYEPLPDNIHFYYDGKRMELSEPTEEIAGFYARMLDHDYTTKDLFNNNFFKDWRKFMTKEERNIITDLRKCNFREICDYYKMKSEERKNMSKEEKLALKKENEAVQKEYGFCIIDGHKQKIGNFKIEPPGLFRGRGDHPKQGMLKTRVQPEDVIINCSKGAKVPSPPPGHKWKEVRHDNTVTWLASWNENVQGQTKYIMLNAASKLKGEKDYNKYETARKLHKRINQIRNTYREDWKSKEMRVRQRAVALYFIDKLALRAGNEKDEDQADTVGCCSLRVEHLKLHEQLDDKQYVVEFDFLGKDSIRYFNQVPVEKRVFKNLQLFMENKQDGDDLFDRLNTGILNKHLQTLMDGLTAKVFRTYNASHTLQEQLDLMSQADGFAELPVAAKMLTYNRANRAVAILCNHQRAVSKTFGKQMENLQAKIDAKKDVVKAAKKELKDAKAELKHSKSETVKNLVAKKQRAYDRAKEQLTKLEVQATDKDENKEIALSTSKLNYLDPRISIAWCKKWDVPIEKVYNKTQREKFAWAIDMTDEDYQF